MYLSGISNKQNDFFIIFGKCESVSLFFFPLGNSFFLKNPLVFFSFFSFFSRFHSQVLILRVWITKETASATFTHSIAPNSRAPSFRCTNATQGAAERAVREDLNVFSVVVRVARQRRHVWNQGQALLSELQWRVGCGQPDVNPFRPCCEAGLVEQAQHLLARQVHPPQIQVTQVRSAHVHKDLSVRGISLHDVRVLYHACMVGRGLPLEIHRQWSQHAQQLEADACMWAYMYKRSGPPGKWSYSYM